MQQNELIHFGVKGMKWGVRKKYYNSDGSLNRAGRARQDYKDAKKELRDARKVNAGLGIGVKGIAKAQAKEKRVNDAEIKVVNARAKLDASKAKNKERAEKAEFNRYRKTMSKSGLPGSISDANSRNMSTRLYKDLETSKGKAYADKVVKSVENRAYATLAVSTVVLVGSTAAEIYLGTRDY